MFALLLGLFILVSSLYADHQQIQQPQDGTQHAIAPIQGCWQTPIATNKSIVIFNGRGHTIDGESRQLKTLFNKVTDDVHVVAREDDILPGSDKKEVIFFVAGHGITALESISEFSAVEKEFLNEQIKLFPETAKLVIEKLAACKKSGVGHCVMTRSERQVNNSDRQLLAADIMTTQEIVERQLQNYPKGVFCVKSGSCFSGPVVDDLEKVSKNVISASTNTVAQSTSFSYKLKDGRSISFKNDIEISSYLLANIMTTPSIADALDKDKDCCLSKDELDVHFRRYIKIQEGVSTESTRQVPRYGDGLSLCMPKV